MPSKKYKEFEKDWEEKKNSNTTFLIGEPIPWSKMITEDNKKEWLWENYIAKGNITLLSALWKAGKSTFLRCLFLAMAQEEEFAGQPTKKCKLLILSEEDRGEWSDKREEVDDALIESVLVWSRPIRIKPNLRQWTELIEEVTERCKEDEIDLVIIDTLTTFWPIDNENDSAQVIKALVPLYNFTENNIAVLLVHHFRKGGGDQAQASRGSGALPGFVDNIIEFTRKEDGSIYQRILKTYGRFDEVIPQIVIELTLDGTYKTLGSPWEVSKNARIRRVIEIFEENPNTLLCSKDVHTFWVTKGDGANIAERSVRRYILELVGKNILSAVESRLNGKKETPYYALTGNYTEQRTIAFPYTNGVVLSSDNLSVVNSGQPPDSLSAVNLNNEATAEDRTGISPINENESQKFLKSKLPYYHTDE